jgi:hypothetical protein
MIARKLFGEASGKRETALVLMVAWGVAFCIPDLNQSAVDIVWPVMTYVGLAFGIEGIKR